ncbi:MAG: hypothetical protein U0263_32080 [Polyangiaceae bacterium]
MKIIRYRGGVVSFRIPQHWLELYELDEGGEFHPGTDDGRVLRIRVTTAQASHAVTPETTANLVRKLHPDTPFRMLRPGDLCTRRTHSFREDDEDLILHEWRVYNTVPPDHLRVVLFTFTIPADLDTEPEILDDIETLDREIMNATFATRIGETPL